MANTIKHKRGTTTPTAGQLVVGEIAINTTTGSVFTKTDAGSVVSVGGGGTWGSITGTLSNQTDLNTALGLKAPLASPVFTGDPTAPTAALGDSDTSLATTAFVQQELASGVAVAKVVVATVRNETGSTISKGSVVYINGAGGNKATVALAQANSETTSAHTYGLVQADINTNNNGTIVISGIISGLNTNGFAAGTMLYLSPTTAGGLTSTKPSAPDNVVSIGVVAYQHANQGTIQLAIRNGFEVEELHNASISSPADNDLFVYEYSTTLWKNKSFATLGLLTDAPSDGDEYVRKDGAWAVATGGGGGGSYLPLAGGTMTGAIVFDATGGQNIDKGTFDSGRYGYNGISLKCAAGFELNWQSGWLTANQFLGTPAIVPIIIDSGAGSTLQVWEGTTSTGVEISHTGITFPDLTTQTTASIADAPSDGTNYGRKDGSWVATLPDAPSDSTQYVRQNGSWVTNSGFTFGDSPSDGNYYVRMGSTGWAQIGSGTDTIATQSYVTSQGYQTSSDVSTAISGLVSTANARKQAVAESARAVLNDSAYTIDGAGYHAFFMAGAFNYTVTNSQFSSSGKWFGIKYSSTVYAASSISLSSGVVEMVFSFTPDAGTGLCYTEDGGTTWFESSIPMSA